MAKRRKLTQPETAKPRQAKEPRFSHTAFQLAVWIIVLGLIAQLVIAAVAYPSLPEHIPSSWSGQLIPGQTQPAWTVFVLFPGGELVLLLIALLPRLTDAAGRRTMEVGKAVGLIVLALLLTALQSSIFHLR